MVSVAGGYVTRGCGALWSLRRIPNAGFGRNSLYSSPDQSRMVAAGPPQRSERGVLGDTPWQLGYQAAKIDSALGGW